MSISSAPYDINEDETNIFWGNVIIVVSDNKLQAKWIYM